MPRFFKMFEKNLFKISAVSDSDFTVTLETDLSKI